MTCRIDMAKLERAQKANRVLNVYSRLYPIVNGYQRVYY